VTGPEDRAGWIGDQAVVLNFLRTIGADRAPDGQFAVVGEPPSSFMGAGEELVIPPGCCYLMDGKPVPLAAQLRATLGDRPGGFGITVI